MIPRYESITEVRFAECRVIVWRHEREFCYGPSREVQAAIAKGLTPNQIALRLDMLTGVYKYEIRGNDGHGACCKPGRE